MKKTAESVTPSHPDKLCDRISDAILDACLEQDPMSRVAMETMGGHGEIKVTGELTTHADVDIEKVIKSIVGGGYVIQQNIVSQSPEIAQGVDTGGAGDQGIMGGYACDDNEDMIPREHYLARNLNQFLYNAFKYDGKTQVTIDDYGAIETIVASYQNVPARGLEIGINQWIVKNMPKIREDLIIHANPAGDWNVGGFEADTGLTGRKLVVDNYGPQIPLGGGCFSGKDATKVDRSAAYMARKIAVDYLKKAKARGEMGIQVWVKLAYAIGVAEPVMATVELDSDKGFQNHDLLATKEYDLTPKGIIEFLQLRKPQFEKTAQWGHFGNGFEWDK